MAFTRFHTFYNDQCYVLAKFGGEGGLAGFINLVDTVAMLSKVASKFTGLNAFLYVGLMVPPPHGHTVSGVAYIEDLLTLQIKNQINNLFRVTIYT